MKIRQSFVSNSSSTSFCIIGLSQYSSGEENTELIQSLADGDVKVDEDGDYDFDSLPYEGKSGLDYYGACGEIYYVGLQAAPLLEENTLPEAKKKVKTFIRQKCGVDIPLWKIELLFGEVSDGG